MNSTIREITINPNLSAQRCHEMIARVETVRQGAIAEAWLTANRTISAAELDEMMEALTLRIREAFRREAAEAGAGTGTAGTNGTGRWTGDRRRQWRKKAAGGPMRQEER